MSAVASSPVPVSVVIPYYGGAETVGRALASLARQTRPPAQVVVVDDGSPEPLNPSALPSLPGLTTLRHEENRGIPAARNTGLGAATQPWVGFLDQDDEWAPDKLERQWRVVASRGAGRGVRPATGGGRPVPGAASEDGGAGQEGGTEPEAGVVVFGRLLVDVTGERPRLRPPRAAIRALEAGGDAAIRTFIRHGNTLPLITLLAPRAVLRRHGGFDESLTGGADDTELVLRLLAEGVPFRHAPCRDGWCARHHVTGANYSADPTRWAGDHLAFIPRLARRYRAIAAVRDPLLAGTHFVLGRHHAADGSRDAALESLARASRLDPWWWKPRAARLALRMPASWADALERAWRRVERAARERPLVG